MNKPETRTHEDVSTLVDFFAFRIMLAPRLMIAFNGVVTLVVLTALVCLPLAMIYFAITGGEEKGEMIKLCGMSFLSLFLGFIVFRIVCEYLILFFRMNETLTEILRKNDGLPRDAVVAKRPVPLMATQPHASRVDIPEITLVPPEAVYIPLTLSHTQPENEIRPGDIVFDCPFCGHNHAISPKGAGIKVSCMKCGKSIAVPRESA